VLEVDAAEGALLIEAVSPGTAVADDEGALDVARVATLLRSLHLSADPAPACRPLSARVEVLFDNGLTNYKRRPDIEAVVPRGLYDRARALALHLAGDGGPTVMLHGDLTPVNVLDGGRERGLVAVDPAPCVGDPAFDAVDLLLWRVADRATLTARAGVVAEAVSVVPERVEQWCAAGAALNAAELAERGETGEQIDVLVALAQQWC
jgi:streptomycin 6-kinase